MSRKANSTENGFSDRVRAARTALGMSQRDLAAEIGVTPGAVAMFENRKSNARFDTLIRLARALDVSLDYLAGLTSEFGKFPLGDEA